MPILNNGLLRHGAKPHYYITFNGSTSGINCGHDASIANLTTGILCVDLWIKAHSLVGIAPMIISKFNRWTMSASVNLYAVMLVNDGVSNGSCYVPFDLTGAWHHLVGLYDNNGDKKPRVAVDGTWIVPFLQNAAVGVLNDSAVDLKIGVNNFRFDGDMSWTRISNNARFTPGVNFTPPDLEVPPVADGNTTELWQMDDGVGAVAHASVNPANDGVMTDCAWGVF